MGTELPFRKMKSSRGGWQGWLPNHVNVLNALEPDT